MFFCKEIVYLFFVFLFFLVSKSPCEEESDKLPTPAKPSLKMRLFCDENKRKLLRNVFENNTLSSSSNKENQPHQSNQNKWLSTTNNKYRTDKKPRILSIDDSF